LATARLEACGRGRPVGTAGRRWGASSSRWVAWPARPAWSAREANKPCGGIKQETSARRRGPPSRDSAFSSIDFRTFGIGCVKQATGGKQRAEPVWLPAGGRRQGEVRGWSRPRGQGRGRTSCRSAWPAVGHRKSAGADATKSSGVSFQVFDRAATVSS